MSETGTDYSRTVVTGQQIGLLGGPLYTAYKVLGAVYLARNIDGNAVYWLETNDADFNEINHIDYLDAGGQLCTLKWDIDSRGYSCGYIEVDETLRTLLETFFDSMRQTDFTPSLKELALSCYKPGRTLADASVMLAKELFGDFELRLFTPFEQEFRRASRSILLKEAEGTPDGQQCNLFCLIDKQRKAIFKKNHKYYLRDDTEIDLNDCTLLPNVMTRSVCQDDYFNTHTYIAGPGEVKYLSEMDQQFRYHGVKKEAVQPRMSITLLEPKVRRLMKKTNLTLTDIRENNREELLKMVMKNDAGFDFNKTLQTGNQLTETYLRQLEELGFDAAEMKKLHKLLRQEIKKNSGMMRARRKEKHQRLLTDTAYLSDNLYPYGKPQERVFNIFYYMNLYGGKEFIKQIYSHYDWDRKQLEIETGD
jgi:bacillithiol synthase